MAPAGPGSLPECSALGRSGAARFLSGLPRGRGSSGHVALRPHQRWLGQSLGDYPSGGPGGRLGQGRQQVPR